MHLFVLFVPFTTEVTDFPTLAYTWGLKKVLLSEKYPPPLPRRFKDHSAKQLLSNSIIAKSDSVPAPKVDYEYAYN